MYLHWRSVQHHTNMFIRWLIIHFRDLWDASLLAAAVPDRHGLHPDASLELHVAGGHVWGHVSAGHTAQEAIRGGEEQSHGAGRDRGHHRRGRTGNNKIILTSDMRFRKLIVVMLRLLSHSKPSLLHQLSLSTSDINKTIILAHDATLLTPWLGQKKLLLYICSPCTRC